MSTPRTDHSNFHPQQLPPPSRPPVSPRTVRTAPRNGPDAVPTRDQHATRRPLVNARKRPHPAARARQVVAVSSLGLTGALVAGFALTSRGADSAAQSSQLVIDPSIETAVVTVVAPAPGVTPPPTAAPAVAIPTTLAPTTVPTTVAATTVAQTTVPTTVAPTTTPTTVAPTTVAPTTVAPTTTPTTTVAPTTVAPQPAPQPAPPQRQQQSSHGS